LANWRFFIHKKYYSLGSRSSQRNYEKKVVPEYQQKKEVGDWRCFIAQKHSDFSDYWRFPEKLSA
jgi:hypothetical protein